MSWARENDERTVELVMSSTVLAKRGWSPQSMARTSWQPSMGWPTARSSAAFALTVLRDGGVTLGERVELLEEEDGARLLVGGEELLYGRPELSSSLIVAGHGEVEDGVADEAEEPTLDTRVGDDPVRIIRDGGAGSVDVRTEAEFAAQNLEIGCPLEVVGGHL